MSKSKLFLSASLILLVSSFDLKASEAKFPNSSGNAKGQSKGKHDIDKKSENFYSTFIKQNFNEFEKGDINSKNNIDFNKLDDFFTKRIAKKLLNKEITLKDMFRNIKVITKVDNFDISNEVIELLQSSQNILTLKEAKREIEKKHYAALLHNAYGIDQDDADFIADSVILNKAKNFKDACESILNIDDYEGVSIQTAVIDKMFKEGLLLQDAMKECKREVHINELKGLGFSSRESSDLADIIMRGGSKLSALEKHLSRQAYATYKNVNCADLIAEEILNNKISLKEALTRTQGLVDESLEAENQLKTAANNVPQPEEREEDSGFADMLSATYKGLNKAQIKEIVKMLDETELSSDEAVTKLISPRYLEENLNSPHKLQSMLDLIKAGKSIQEAFDTLNQPEEMEEDSGFADMLSATYKGLNKAQIKEIVKMLDETELSSDEAVTKLLTNFKAELFHSPDLLNTMLTFIKNGQTIEKSYEEASIEEGKKLVDYFYKGLIETDLEQTSRLHFYSKKPYTAENIKESLHKYIRNLGYDNKIAENLVERTYLNKSRKTFRKQSLEMFCKDILSKLANKEQAELLLKNEEKVKEENKARLARKQEWDAASFRAKVIKGSLRNGLICEVTFKSNNNTQKLDLGELFYVAPQAYKTFFNLPDHISIGDEIRFHTIRNNGKLFSTGMGEDIVVPNPNYNKPIYDMDGNFAEMDSKPEVRLSGKLKLVSEILSPENIKPSYAYQALLKWGTFEKGYIGIITEARTNDIEEAKSALKALNLNQVKDFEDFIETCVKAGYKNSNFNPYQAINNSLYGASDFNEEDFKPSLSVQEIRHKLAWFFRERLVYIAPKQYQADFSKDEMELNTCLKIETISSNAVKTPFATGDYDRLNEVTSLFK